MKVIEEGPGWFLEKKCTGAGNGNCGCGSTLRIEKEDLFRTHSYHYDGSHETYVTFECIICGEWNDVDDRLPSQFNIPERDKWLKQKETE